MRTAQMTADPHEAHAALRRHVDNIKLAARELPDISPEERHELTARILDFLRDTLLPYLDEEDRSVYPAVAEILGNVDATAPMIYDHIAIRARIVELGATEDVDLDRLQCLLYGLHALIAVHLWKEERLYMSLFDRPAWRV
jgi:hypothetical protein